MHAVIHLHPAAPDKPALAQTCNGCGVCCMVAPCPIGVVVSRRTRGPCAALRWVDEESVYRCGLVAQPAAHLPAWSRFAAPLLARIAHRYISAGSGCDSDLLAERRAIG